ncbi:MAG: hypothetical protein JJ897_02445 [Marinibacterium sp.]|nr:hypothetical protein [Marinibacterium sp.]
MTLREAASSAYLPSLLLAVNDCFEPKSTDAAASLNGRNEHGADVLGWELNEGFDCQVLYCRHHLGIDPESYNVNGGAILICHPYGITGARQVGHALLEGRRRSITYVVTSMCVGRGIGPLRSSKSLDHFE